MASIIKEFVADAPIERVWEAFCDYGAVATRVARGFVAESRLDGDVRHVRFVNGLEADERLVTIDEEHHRIVYSASSGRLSHHNASHQMWPTGDGRTRIVWTTDLLPEEAAPAVAAMMDAGAHAAQVTLAAVA